MDLRSSGMEFASEFVIKAAQIAQNFPDPDYFVKDKRGRPPHLKSFRDGWRHTRFMLLYAPNWLFHSAGGLLMCAGLFLTCWLLPGPRKIPPITWCSMYITMIFGVIFTLMGAQILAIGAFAKVFSYAERFDRNTVSLKRILKRVTLNPVCCWAARCSWVGLQDARTSPGSGRRADLDRCNRCAKCCSGRCGCSWECRLFFRRFF